MLLKLRPSLRSIILIGLFILSSVPSFGQRKHPLSLNLSYFGETITHPGFKVGLEYPLRIKNYNKSKRNDINILKEKQIIVGTNIGLFHQRKFSTSLFFNGEIGYRIIRKKGFKIELLLGIGCIRNFINEDTYSVNSEGIVKKIKFAGQSGFLPSISLGIGKDFGFVSDKKWGYHIKPSFYIQTPYNNTVFPRFVLELGITYKLNQSSRN